MGYRWHHGLCLFLLAATPRLQAQTPAPGGSANAQAPLMFDVVSVRPNHSGSSNSSIETHPTSYTATNVSLIQLMNNAYDIRPDLISGQPGWAESEHFDVQAKILEGSAEDLRKLTPDQRRGMLRAMLADRFHLVAHVETKTLPVYNLVLTKDGPKFKPTVHPADDGGTSTNDANFEGHAIPVRDLAVSLAGMLQRTILDKTNLTGTYDFTLHWTRDGAASSDSSFPPLFTALQEQLGLKLESAKGPVDTLVVDHVERPTEN